MLKSWPSLVFLISLFFFSCGNNNKYPYSITDFGKPLQPELTKMVTGGIVMGSDSILYHMVTDVELIRLTQSEHPIIRTSAFREILNRKTMDHYEILMNHLDDTALIFMNAGEFGIWERMVSDDMLQESTWKTQEEKDKTIEKVLTKHNYLKSAYIILGKIEAQEKYYGFIKNMASRPRRLTDEEIELGFDDIEYALYGLAKFKKQGDIVLIRDKMMKNAWQLSFMSLRLITEYPDTAYFDVLSAYRRKQFYRTTGHSRNGFTGYVTDRADPEEFIQALAMQQSVRSAKLLDTMLNLLPLQQCLPNRKSITNEIIRQIWDHPCPAYQSLRRKVKRKALELKKDEIVFPLDPSGSSSIDTVKKIIYW